MVLAKLLIMALAIPKSKITIFVIIVIATFLVITNVVNAKPCDDLHISFAKAPPHSIIQFQNYQMSVNWENPEHKKAYDGHFVFLATSHNSKIDVKDIVLTYKGVTIQPHISGKNLEYSLPNETFLPSRSGRISVDVTFNKQGSYNWEIGIIKK
jgi:hypothetical protein